jgi:hypothetical protein
MPLAARTNLMDVAVNDDPVAGSLVNSGNTFVYVPLNFSFLRNGLSMNLDLSFLEQIECNVELEALDQIATTTTGLSLDADNTELLCYYYNLSESDLRKYEDAEFSLSKPLSMMASSTYQESDKFVEFTADGSGNTTESGTVVSFSCPNVVVKTMIVVDKVLDNGAATTGVIGSFYPVEKVEYYMSGRLVWSSTGVEEQKLENSLFYGTGYGAPELASSGSADTYQNVYTHFWSIANEPSRFSGGCSGKNISDWSCKVFLKPTDVTASQTDKFRIRVFHQYINIVSISGSSGKVGVSLSL